MRFLRTILDLIFPPGTDETRMRSLTQESVTKLMGIGRHAETVTLFPYRHKIIRTLIWRLKYKDDGRAARLLGDVLATYLSTELSGAYLVIPIPLSRTRRRERGYNQVTRVALEAIKALPNLTLAEGILMRVHDHERQTTLSRLERIRNMRGQFQVRNPRSVVGKDVILLDDVITTGATMREAEKALLSAGAEKVIKIALAH